MLKNGQWKVGTRQERREIGPSTRRDPTIGGVSAKRSLPSHQRLVEPDRTNEWKRRVKRWKSARQWALCGKPGTATTVAEGEEPILGRWLFFELRSRRNHEWNGTPALPWCGDKAIHGSLNEECRLAGRTHISRECYDERLSEFVISCLHCYKSRRCNLRALSGRTLPQILRYPVILWIAYSYEFDLFVQCSRTQFKNNETFFSFALSQQ